MMRKLTLIMLLAVIALHADPSRAFGQDHVFVQALKAGSASTPIADEPMFARAVVALQRQAGNAGPIYIEAKRIITFREQGRCGRIAFAITQPASHHVWANLGGQLNICDDGQPPLRSCPGSSHLVPAVATCAGGGRPVETAEVAAAIQAAVQAGGLTPAQAQERFSLSSHLGKQEPPQ